MLLAMLLQEALAVTKELQVQLGDLCGSQALSPPSNVVALHHWLSRQPFARI